MNYYLRTNEADMTSYGGFQWPVEVGATVVAPDWNPIAECGNGLHGLKDGKGNLNLLSWYKPDMKWVVFSSSDEGVDLKGKVKVQKATVEYIGDVNGAIGFFAEREGLTVREWVCKDPEWVYRYARNVDKESRDDMRRGACASPKFAYQYARNVDKKGCDDTRRAVCASPEFAYLYAMNVDKGGHDDTRRAVCANPKFAYQYARDIDKKGRDDTQEAVSQDPGLVSHYTRLFGK